MRWMKILIIVIGSAWFFPVSCTATLFAGTHLVAEFDTRNVSKGDSVHSLFKVVVETGEDGKPLRVVRLDELSGPKERMTLAKSSGNISFLMSNPNGNFDASSSSISYQVTENSKNEQVIEVVESYHDGDNIIWSRYKATQSTISPISSRMFYFGQMFSAFPYAFGFALILYTLGRFLQRRYHALGLKNDES